MQLSLRDSSRLGHLARVKSSCGKTNEPITQVNDSSRNSTDKFLTSTWLFIGGITGYLKRKEGKLFPKWVEVYCVVEDGIFYQYSSK